METVLVVVQDTLVDSLGAGSRYALEGAAAVVGAAFGLLGVFAQELVKKGLKVIQVWDTAIGAAIKPIQPILAGALGLLLAFLWTKLPLGAEAPPVELLLTAPIGTLLGVALREAALRIGSKG